MGVSWAPMAVMAGANLIGGAMGGKGGGKGGGSVNVQPSPFEQAMGKIATDYYKATGPTRGYFLEDWASFLRPAGGTGYGAGAGGYYTPGYYAPGTSQPGGTTAQPGGAATAPPDYAGYGYYSNPSGELVPFSGTNAMGLPSNPRGATQYYQGWSGEKPQQPQFVGMADAQTPIYSFGGKLFYPSTPYEGGNIYDTFQQSLRDYQHNLDLYEKLSPQGTEKYPIAKPEYSYNPWGLLKTGYGGDVTQKWLPYQGDYSGVEWIPGYTPPTGAGAGATPGQYVPGQYVPGAGGGGNLYGGYDPYKIPGYAPLYQLARGGLESQFQQAREGIMGSLPRGGALGENLSNLEMARAVQAGSLPAQIAAPLIQDIMNKAYGAAFGAPTTTLSGLGGAASSYAGRYGSALASQNQGGGLLGAGLGSLAAMGMGGKGGKGAAAPVEYMMGGGMFI